MDQITDQIGSDLAALVFAYLPLREKLAYLENLARYEKDNLVCEDSPWQEYSDMYSGEVYPRDDDVYPNEVFVNGEEVYPRNGENLDRVWRREYTLDGIPHRTDGPAWIEYGRDGHPHFESWIRNGSLYRADGPARTDYIVGQIQKEIWYRYGKIHREDGPALIHYDTSGRPILKKWFQFGLARGRGRS